MDKTQVFYKKVDEFQVKDMVEDFSTQDLAVEHARTVLMDHNVISDIHIKTGSEMFKMNNIHKD